MSDVAAESPVDLPSVTVVTVTHDRPELLLRAMTSVAEQEEAHVDHVVVGDDCPALADPEFAARISADFPLAKVLNEPRPADSDAEYLPTRLGRLRNLGISLGSGDFVAQLDDDNTFAPHHLASLLRALHEAPDAGVAHSWRRLVLLDGTEYVPDGEDPWHPDPQARPASYDRLVELGVFVPGSPVVRDTFQRDGELIARVDTSEFLVRREVHKQIPFPVTFSSARQRMQWTEDFVFAISLGRAGVGVVCTREATLNYTMGGYSNRDALQLPAGEVQAGNSGM